MDLVDNVGKRVKVDTTQKKKKKRGGTKFSNTKAMKRNAQRRKEASMSIGEERYCDEIERSDDEGSVLFRRHTKMHSINLEPVVEIVEKVDVDEREDGQDIQAQEDYMHQSPSHCDSLGFDSFLNDQCEKAGKEVLSAIVFFLNSLCIVYYSFHF